MKQELEQELAELHIDMDKLAHDNKKVIRAHNKYIKAEQKIFKAMEVKKKIIAKIKIQELTKQVDGGVINWKELLDSKLDGASNLLEKAIKQSCLSTSGYFPDNYENALQIKLRKNEKQNKIDKTEAFIKEYIKYSNPLLSKMRMEYDYSYSGDKTFDITITENKVFSISIFEKTLSEYCSYHLTFIQDMWLITASRYSSSSIVFENRDLAVTLLHIKAHFYY